MFLFASIQKQKELSMKLSVLLCLMFLVQFSFGQTSEGSTHQNLYEFSREQILPIIQSNDAYKPFAKYIRNGVRAYRITHESYMNGRKVILSGSILIPTNQEKPGITVFCHGTQFDQNVSSTWNAPLHIEALPALNGYITFLPDYLGYGSSMGEMPAYFDKENSLIHLEDFIKSGLGFLEKKGIEYRRELNIIGFSQGGHLALAFAEKHKQDHSFSVPIQHVISIGGPTDLVESLRYVIQQDTFLHAGYIPYLLGVHNHYYWKKSLSTFFQPPHDQIISEFINGEGLQELNEKTPTQIEVFLQSEFRSPKSKLFRRVARNLKKHSVKPFKSDSPLTFIHSRLDEDVPFDILNRFYLQMEEKNGSNSIRLIEVDGDHNTSGLIGMAIAMDVIDQ